MRRIHQIIAALALTALIGCSRGEIFRPHHPALKKLSSGMEVMALEDREFPTSQIFLYIQGGSLYDPPGKEGLASISMQSLRLGGAEGRPPDSIEKELEFDGSSLEMGAGAEYLTVSLTGLKDELNHGLDVLFDLLRKPAFDPARFELVKARAQDGLLREMEDPLRLAFREFPSQVYGEDAAWGRRPTAASIASITRDDVLNFYQRFIQPDRILVAAAGDFSVGKFVEKIDKRQRGWTASAENLSPIPPIEEGYDRRVVIIPRKNLTQSTIVVGHLGGKRSNPDKYPLLVMNFILGGSGALTSRLGEEIRSSAGKAYSVWSDYGFGKDFGLFREIAQTQLENTEWVTQKLKEILKTVAQQPNFTDQEVDSAKKAILRGLIFDFETRFSQVKEQARFRLWGYPKNYLEIFQHEVGAVTQRDVERVAKKYLHPDGLKILVVTDESMAESLKASLAGLAGPKGVEIRRMD